MDGGGLDGSDLSREGDKLGGMNVMHVINGWTIGGGYGEMDGSDSHIRDVTLAAGEGALSRKRPDGAR